MSTIRWSPYSSLALNKPSTTVIFGTLGSGKTVHMISTALNEIAMGRRVLAIDGKNDMEKIKKIHKEVEVIAVNDIREGALNPFTFLDDIDASSLLTIIELLVGKLSDEKATAITPIIQDFITKFQRENEYKDMMDVANYLFSRDNKDAQSVGSALRLFSDGKGYGKLLFTRETNIKPLQLSKRSSIVISLFGMSMPLGSKDPNDYTSEERLTTTIVYLITKKLRYILTHNKEKLPTVLFCDEAHLFFSNEEMTRLLDEFMSLGRSLKVATVLASQGANRFPDISRYVSSKFMFANSLEDAKLFLEKFDSTKHQTIGAIDVNYTTTTIATKLKVGQCFFIDGQNRSGFIQITPIYPLELFD